MAAAEIRVVNPGNLQKIESFFNDSAYREAIENSANFNTRLCVERRLRMPFLDPQTGVAQTHCNLFMSRRQRMPGAREGQLYTYPAARWRKAKRQYLSLRCGGWGGEGAGLGVPSCEEPTEGELSQAPMDTHDTDSKDSHHHKDDVSKEWFYDDMTMEELDQLEEPEPDSDEDYMDESYAARRKRGAGAADTPARGTPPAKAGRRSKAPPEAPETPVTTPKGRGRGGGRGRKKAVQQSLPYEVAGDADKPYGCDLCGARYKTRPGLTYHYTHSHKEGGGAGAGGGGGGGGGSDGDSRDSPARSTQAAAPAAPAGPVVPPDQPSTEYQDSYVTFITGNTGAVAGRSSPPVPGSAAPVIPASSSSSSAAPPSPPAGAQPPASPGGTPAAPAVPASHSPYCDFCLGDHTCNKKSGIPEELVSCSDCGRSGHPTCLQFTDNMIVSVRKYRWQCIECKCCSVCGTSDNDDQLLFCDDCDRGYHMYCLAPPLHAPPEGSWSCSLCIKEFHQPR